MLSRVRGLLPQELRERIEQDGETWISSRAYDMASFPSGYSDSQDVRAQHASDAVRSATPQELFVAGLKERGRMVLIAGLYIGAMVGSVAGIIAQSRGQ